MDLGYPFKDPFARVRLLFMMSANSTAKAAPTVHHISITNVSEHIHAIMDLGYPFKEEVGLSSNSTLVCC
jgi:hypothetical protein